MIHSQTVHIHAEREKLAANLEQHRQIKNRMIEVIETVSRLKKESSALQQEAEHLVAQSREVKQHP